MATQLNPLPAPPSVLLVDDHEANRSMLKRRLEKAGYAVLTAADGQQAIDTAVTHAPDIILMDLAMPNMDGIEAWRGILARTTTPPPVIALTAADIRDVRETCANLGFRRYMLKPFEFSELLSAINESLPPEKSRHMEGGDTPDRHVQTLSKRQLECVILAARGKSDWEIGHVLNISKDTAHKHVQSAMQKLGVASRTQLAVRALYESMIRFSDIIE